MNYQREKMYKTTSKLLLTSAIATLLFTGCTKYEQSLKVLPNEIQQANQCIDTDKEFEANCYDLIAHKNSVALLRLGILENAKSNYKDAFDLYTLAQQRGNFYANALLADLYFNGRGIKQDQEMGLKLLKDVDNVDPLAAYKLSFYYISKKDYSEAIKLLTFAANNNVKKAQLELSKAYANGTIVKMNSEKSIFWMQKHEEMNEDFMNKIYGI